MAFSKRKYVQHKGLENAYKLPYHPAEYLSVDGFLTY